MEWQKDYEEAEPGHRHISHLWALHPAHQITKDGTPELCQAAEITLQRRLAAGGGHTGWSRAWIMNLYARLWQGEQVYANLLQLFSHSTLPNLLDNHALPRAWKDGEVKGLCGVGGVVYDLSWKNHSLTTAVLHAAHQADITLRYQDSEERLSMMAGQTITLDFPA